MVRLLRFARNDNRELLNNLSSERVFKNVVAQFIGLGMPDKSGNYKD